MRARLTVINFRRQERPIKSIPPFYVPDAHEHIKSIHMDSRWKVDNILIQLCVSLSLSSLSSLFFGLLSNIKGEGTKKLGIATDLAENVPHCFFSTPSTQIFFFSEGTHLLGFFCDNARPQKTRIHHTFSYLWILDSAAAILAWLTVDREHFWSNRTHRLSRWLPATFRSNRKIWGKKQATLNEMGSWNESKKNHSKIESQGIDRSTSLG